MLRHIGPVLLVLLSMFACPSAAETITIDKVLIQAGSVLARPAVEIDPVEGAWVAGNWVAPDPSAPGPDWQVAESDSAGWIGADELIHGYAYAEVEVAGDGVWWLDAMGYAGVIVNGVPRIGNIYGYTDDWAAWQPHFDFSRVPVRLQAGRNTFLFHGNRYGLMRARLTRAETPLGLNPKDTTLPDLVVGEAYDGWGAIVVMNATDEVVTNAELVVAVDGSDPVRSVVPPLPPCGVRKVGFAIKAPATASSGSRPVHVSLQREGLDPESASLSLNVVDAAANRRVTFRSRIDDSVQYYGLLPSSGPTGPKALFLSLHGASVEAINQSGSYVPLAWGDLVAPTNRRPFGFSWEDWGRLDAIEVLDIARAELQPAADRIYLTGHSMGGHGSWQLASLFPDRFAAVGPSAGWISLWSYRQSPPTAAPSPLTTLIETGTLSSETLKLAPNLAGLGVYVLHGDQDDNVPAAQAHLMLAELERFHHDYVYHEQPGVGHWWDLSDDPGADCVSWPPMFDYFARHRRSDAAETRAISFRTPSPGISATDRWVTIHAQQRPFRMSAVDLRRDEGWRHVSGTTENTAVLGLDLSRSRLDSVRVELDGDVLQLAVPADGHVWLERGKQWRTITHPNPAAKGAHNNGGFRSAFDDRAQFVYATGGTAAENDWARAKARYDAEYLWYQGNASIDVLPDTLFDPAAEPERDVVLYGNADSHRHWAALWSAPVQVDRAGASLDGREPRGDDLGVIAVYPRPGSRTASVGIVAPSGAEGARLLARRPYLRLGVAYPDVTVFRYRGHGPTTLAAGYFGNDWSLAAGEFVWEDHR